MKARGAANEGIKSARPNIWSDRETLKLNMNAARKDFQRSEKIKIEYEPHIKTLGAILKH